MHFYLIKFVTFFFSFFLFMLLLPVFLVNKDFQKLHCLSQKHNDVWCFCQFLWDRNEKGQDVSSDWNENWRKSKITGNRNGSGK